MTFEADSPLERAYPYRPGWPAACCGVFMFGVIGSVAAALVPIGYEQLQNGQLPVGIAMMIGGLFGIPMLLMAAMSVAIAIRDAFRPPLLRVTPSALLLPMQMRAESTPEEVDESGETKQKAPLAHPETLPFAAVRSVRRESKVNPGSDKLIIEHDLAPIPLVIEQFMMQRPDFDELELVLRTAMPAAFEPVNPSE